MRNEFHSEPIRTGSESLTEEQARAFIDALPQLAWLARPDGYIFWYNHLWKDYTGVSPSEMDGWGWQAVHDEAALPTTLARWSECIRSGQPFEMELRLRGSDGRIRPFLTRGVPVRNVAGAIAHWVGTNTDISAQRSTEEALRVSEARYRETWDHAPIGMAHLDVEGRFIRVNPALCKITGLTEAEFRTRTIRDLTVPETYEKDLEQARRLRDGELDRYVVDKRYVRADGSFVWVNVTATAVHDERGKVQHFLAIVEDISRRKQTEVALGETMERFDLISRATNDVLWDWDVRRDTLWWSDGIVPVFGINADAPSSLRDWSERIRPEDRERVMGSFHAALDSDRLQWTEEFGFRKGDGLYATVRDRGFIVRDPQGEATRVVGAIQDVTLRKQAEMRLVEAQLELQQHAVRLESAVAERTARLQELVNELGTFSYSISHDLRAPLRAIQGFAELLREDVGETLPETDRSHLDRIIRASQRMDALIKDVLEYSRITRADLTLEEIDPGEVINQLVETHEQFRTAGARIELIEPFPHVKASRPALTQSLSNLLGNAVKFVAQGVVPHVRVRGESRGHRVRIWVEDNGIGIAPKDHEKIWGMLERLNPAYEGTGVGLSIVRKAVERMGGAVGLESTVGQGSRFWLELPGVE